MAFIIALSYLMTSKVMIQKAKVTFLVGLT